MHLSKKIKKLFLDDKGYYFNSNWKDIHIGIYDTKLGDSLKYITNEYIENMERVKYDYRELKNIENQTDGMCILAIRQNYKALEYVKNQTEELCLEAIKYNYKALEYVKEQTEYLCLEAIKKDCNALKYVRNKTEGLIIKAISHSSNIDVVYLQHLYWKNYLLLL